ncbi:MAG: hypothetical protein ACR2LN_06010 [Candidatus Levyibacteriota bacterium]
MRKRKSEDVAAVILGIILVLIVLGILLVIGKSHRASQQTTSTPPPIPTSAPTPAPLNGHPPVMYEQRAMDKILKAIEDRKTLSQDDVVAKANILSLLPPGQQSGSLYYNSDISIEYIHSADLFQVEVLTTDIKTAKDEANVWLRAHGLSQEAICILPVEFYLNYDIANQLRQSNITFSPLGNGCSQ